ncbi:hypothetical protein Ancab_017475 [Ancistrocladus abbreviatus]
MTQLLDPSGAMKNRTCLCVKGYLAAHRYVDGIVNTVLMIKEATKLEASLSEVKAVDDCQIDYQIGFRGWLVDLSGTLQRGYGEPDDGAVKKGIGGTVRLTSATHLMESGGLKMNPKEAQMLQAESGKRENRSSKSRPKLKPFMEKDLEFLITDRCKRKFSRGGNHLENTEYGRTGPEKISRDGKGTTGKAS